MSARKPQPPITSTPQPLAPRPRRFYRGKPHPVMTLGEIARHCRQMAWEIDPDAETVH
jgi:hypothetical protein